MHGFESFIEAEPAERTDAMNAGRMTVYGDSMSGNCHKVRMLLAARGGDPEHDWVEMDILAGDAGKEDFLAINPLGKIPALVLPDGRVLTESNAILFYLAQGTGLLPEDPYLLAQVLQWCFFEQYSHEPYIATSRFIIRYLGNPPERRAELEQKREKGEKALEVMEGHLGKVHGSGGGFFVGGRYSIADIALYAYTHVAGEGGFSLDGYPHIRKWIGSVEATVGFLAMEQQSHA